ncbi:hypothetical protein RU639_010415 [Aspergillus parasiticus]
MRKYRFTPTKGGPYFPIGGKAQVQHVLRKRVAGTLEAGKVPADDPQNDSLYLAPASTLCPTKSSAFKELPGSSWEISFGDSSSASGAVVGTDTIALGGLTVKNQAIELADTLSAQFQQGTDDRLLGLAFSNINTVQPQAVRTPVENMVAQDDIPHYAELLTAKLGSCRDADEPDIWSPSPRNSILWPFLTPLSTWTWRTLRSTTVFLPLQRLQRSRSRMVSPSPLQSGQTVWNRWIIGPIWRIIVFIPVPLQPPHDLTAPSLPPRWCELRCKIAPILELY